MVTAKQHPIFNPKLTKRTENFNKHFPNACCPHSHVRRHKMTKPLMIIKEISALILVLVTTNLGNTTKRKKVASAGIVIGVKGSMFDPLPKI